MQAGRVGLHPLGAREGVGGVGGGLDGMAMGVTAERLTRCR